MCRLTINRILEMDSTFTNIVPVLACCLYELNQQNKLYRLSHSLSEKFPNEASTWFCVGIYYLSLGKIAEARCVFSKASLMSPHFGPAWIGFAHSFAMEGEHDQAISAYTTAARLFEGSHLPSLFLGMQHMELGNIVLAEEFYNSAYRLNKSDPLLLNELGVVAYAKGRYADAVTFCKSALKLVDEGESEPSAWVSVWINLGHSHRKLKKYRIALEYFEEAAIISANNARIATSKGLCYLYLEDYYNAIFEFHQVRFKTHYMFELLMNLTTIYKGSIFESCRHGRI